MPKKQRKFADDGWAVWVDGDDVSTIYINDWLNPKGKSFVDFAVRIRGVMASKLLNVYVPFLVEKDEIEDVSFLFNDKNILQATFSASCIIEYKKNECTSEIAYNGKIVDIVHLSTLEFETTPLSEGTLIKIDLEKLHSNTFLTQTNPFPKHRKRKNPKHRVRNVIKHKHRYPLTKRCPCVIHHHPPAVEDIPYPKTDACQKQYHYENPQIPWPNARCQRPNRQNIGDSQ